MIRSPKIVLRRGAVRGSRLSSFVRVAFDTATPRNQGNRPGEFPHSFAVLGNQQKARPSMRKLESVPYSRRGNVARSTATI